MSQQFKDQGGAATMNPSPLRRWLMSKFMSSVSSEARMKKRRAKAEAVRVSNGEAHVVEYFHQVEDGYSHLAAQVLQKLCSRYDVELKCYLVSGPVGKNAPEPDLLLKLSRYDSYHVAPHYGLEFPQHDAPLDERWCGAATAILASLLSSDASAFVDNVDEVGQAMWAGNESKLGELGASLGSAGTERVDIALKEGNQRRAELKHYSGAMFYYAGEWYWGVDRLHHLENRLNELGLDKTSGGPQIAPRAELEFGPLKDSGRLTLEIYPSLRSPYTAAAFDKTVALTEETGVNLEILPVLPMVMRGVPATREKGAYILFDTGREARTLGVPFGPCADPIGEPARRAYSLLAWAKEQGKEQRFISSFLKCAWVDAVNTNNDKGMRAAVEGAGLDWAVAKTIIGNSEWQERLEANRLRMYEMGLWGVPSYRLVDANGDTLLALWGQDRLWLIAKEIQKQLKINS